MKWPFVRRSRYERLSQSYVDKAIALNRLRARQEGVEHLERLAQALHITSVADRLFEPHSDWEIQYAAGVSVICAYCHRYLRFCASCPCAERKALSPGLAEYARGERASSDWLVELDAEQEVGKNGGTEIHP